MAYTDADLHIGVGVAFPEGTDIVSCTLADMGGIYGIPYTHLSLDEYWEWLQVPEPFAYGIRNHPDYKEGKGCGDYWQQSQRYWLASAISKAEQRLKSDRWLGFPIRREYNDGTGRAREVQYAWPVYLNKYLRGIGVEAETTVESDKDLSLVSDPVTFSVAVDFTDRDELVIYYPGQRKYRIRPSCISISGGYAYIEIPRCRLLRPQYLVDYDEDSDRPDYTVDAYFLSTVDVVRNYLNTTTGANLVWHRKEGDTYGCCADSLLTCNPSTPCEETLQLACGYVRSQRDGIAQFEPATYNGSWRKASYAVKRKPDYLQINYMRGYADRYEELDPNLVRAIVALAHNNMPTATCFRCAITQQYYDKDTKPLEPPVNLGLGPSTWGIFEAAQIIKEFDNTRNAHHGGCL